MNTSLCRLSTQSPNLALVLRPPRRMRAFLFVGFRLTDGGFVPWRKPSRSSSFLARPFEKSYRPMCFLDKILTLKIKCKHFLSSLNRIFEESSHIALLSGQRQSAMPHRSFAVAYPLLVYFVRAFFILPRCSCVLACDCMKIGEPLPVFPP